MRRPTGKCLRSSSAPMNIRRFRPPRGFAQLNRQAAGGLRPCGCRHPEPGRRDPQRLPLPRPCLHPGRRPRRTPLRGSSQAGRNAQIQFLQNVGDQGRYCPRVYKDELRAAERQKTYRRWSSGRCSWQKRRASGAGLYRRVQRGIGGRGPGGQAEPGDMDSPRAKPVWTIRRSCCSPTRWVGAKKPLIITSYLGRKTRPPWPSSSAFAKRWRSPSSR